MPASIEELHGDLDEEETLEGAADLGTMIREMSIDEITRVGAEDEDDDLEEEDAIDDGTYETFETDATEEDEAEAGEAEELAQDEYTENGDAIVVSEGEEFHLDRAFS